MAAAAVVFHPAAAQEAESAYDSYVVRNPWAAQSFRNELRHAIDAVSENPGTWPRHGARGRRYVFPRFPSAWCTWSAAIRPKSSPSLTVGAGRATGDRGSDACTTL